MNSKHLQLRRRKAKVFHWLCRVTTFISIAVLIILIWHIAKEGLDWLSFQFLDSFPSRHVHKAGIKSALWGSIWLISMTAVISIPVGVASAIYFENYAPKNKFITLLQINISNLAGLPSIIYGLLGLSVFVRYFELGRSLWSGSLTLSLLVLPIIIIASQEAIRAVPKSIYFAGFALGARRWQVVFGQVLPAAIPGIMTSIILAMSRAIGESAPLIMVGALSYIAFVPEGPSDPFTVLPVQIYNWSSRPQEDFQSLAGAGIIVLLAVLFTLNLTAVLIRYRFQRIKQ